MKAKNMTTLHSRKSITPECFRGCLLIPIALCCFALSSAPNVFGVTPAPDGAYPGANTAEGQSALQNLTSGIHDTALGYQTLFSNTIGHDNMASGFQALYSNTTGNYETATGSQALYKNTTGNYNTATGFRALYGNTTGRDNTSNGYEALALNSTGQDNMANGFKALYNNTTGYDNTANGSQALYSNTTGHFNTANGFQALYSNVGNGDTATGYQALYHDLGGSFNGGFNTANGYVALFNNTTGGNNTAIGANALTSNTSGFLNTANGAGALGNNTTGFYNTATGASALEFNTAGDNNTAIGSLALNNTTGSANIAVGFLAGQNLTTGDNNIDIYDPGVGGESNTIRIGTVGTQTATFIAGIANATVTGSAVFIDTTTGQLGLLSSSERFKDGIESMGEASEALLSLRPVTFRYKKNIDPKSAPQFGLVAEEVEKVNPDLVVRDAEGKVFTVRYEAVNAMLLNEFLKEHSTVQELKSTVAKQETTGAQQQKEIKALIATVKEQATQIQKVSVQLEASKSATQVVVNEQ